MRAYVDLQELRLTLEGIGKPRPVIAKNDASAPKTRARSNGPVGDAKPTVPATPQAPDPGQSTTP